MFCLFPEFQCCKLNTINFLFLQLPGHFWKCLVNGGNSRHFWNCLDISGNVWFPQMPATYIYKICGHLWNLLLKWGLQTKNCVHPWGRCRQHFMCSFYMHWSQRCKRHRWLACLFCSFGICTCESCEYNVSEIDTRCQFHQCSTYSFCSRRSQKRKKYS